MMNRIRRSFVSFGRVGKSGFVNFFRNWWLSIAATSIMLVTLLIISGTFLFNQAISDTLDDLSKDLTVSVYIQDDTTEEQQLQLKSEIESDENVTKVTFTSKAQAKRDYLEENEFSPELIEAVGIVGGDTFPASFEAQLNDLTASDGFKRIIEQDKYSDVVESYSEERLNTAREFGEIQKSIVNVGLVIGGIFTGISMLIIFNTIRMAIFTRRDEIRMMKLIGATKNFIRAPFLFESSLYGIISGSLTTAIIYFGLKNIGDVASTVTLSGIKQLVADNILVGGAAIVLIGVIIGVISSLLAMARHLRLNT